MTLDEWIAKTRQNIITQDNACTSHPMFIVQQKRRIYGFEPGHGTNEDDVVWLDDDDHFEPDEYKQLALDAAYEATGEEPEGYTKTGYTDIWEFCTACFTMEGCEDYLAANGHNLHEPRIYVESGYRNQEWQRVRALLLGKWSEK